MESLVVFENPSVRRVCVGNFARILTWGLLFLTMVSSIGSCLGCKVFEHFLNLRYGYYREYILSLAHRRYRSNSISLFLYLQFQCIVCILAMMPLKYGLLYKCLYDL